MEWSDEAIVLGGQPHGETSVVVQLFTPTWGRHAGLVRGGRSQRLAGTLQPGTLVTARWRARLAENLGTLTVELEESFAARVLDDPLRLAALTSVCAVMAAATPERQPAPHLYEALKVLLPVLTDSPFWGEALVRWELGVLDAAGFGLDLTRCAAGGSADDLCYVSPRTGRAVSREAGAPYADRLLPLPEFVIGRSAGGLAEVADGLRLTGHFLERHLFGAVHAGLPAARIRLAEAVRRAGNPPAD